jgi:hypothetical protein
VPLFSELAEIEAHPEPAYPEYDEVCRLARVESGPFVDPAKFRYYEYLPAQRGADWCTAVLGRPFHGIRHISCLEFDMLIVADRLELNPPLPPRILCWREEDRVYQAEAELRRQAVQDRDMRRWQAALAACPVEVMLEVRPNVHGRRYLGGGHEALRHAVPTEDALSGRSRLHRAGRALCETVTRVQSLRLGEPVDDPATCVRCLDWMAQVRLAQGA